MSLNELERKCIVDENGEKVANLNELEIIENQMKEDIEHTQGLRFDNFIPYVQLHEFEALIFLQ